MHPDPGHRSPYPADRSGVCTRSDIGATSSPMHTGAWQGSVLAQNAQKMPFSQSTKRLSQRSWHPCPMSPMIQKLLVARLNQGIAKVFMRGLSFLLFLPSA